MQKLIKFNFFVSLLFLGACNSNSKVKENIQVDKTEELQSFFPVTDFILGQLNELDSLPVTPLKITINSNKTDSVWLKKKDIRVFAEPFLHPVIDSISLQKFFSEKSFLDQTINAVTLSYDPKIRVPDSIKLTRWDIYIDPQKNKIERIYLVKEEFINGANVSTQLTWKVNKWCSIRTIEQEAKTAPQIKEEIMKWEFDE